MFASEKAHEVYSHTDKGWADRAKQSCLAAGTDVPTDPIVVASEAEAEVLLSLEAT